ncbi:MAG TPA: ABC transporter permease [Candidatus Paceibacterota bacterium]|nr:ABC transporter permease [Verrucomicrobiota bacterium]HRY47359.1 ABC transporter permease [Candidatus Paceibacterota bacterium]
MYFARRIAFLVPLLLIISLLAFLLVRLAPGGPFDRERKPASPEIERNLREKYHLDEPLWKQYARFLGGLAKGDFGPSLKYRNHGVTDIIKQGLPVSMTLGLLAFGWAVGTGIPLGFAAALGRSGWRDYTASFCAVLAVCIPGFVIGPLLVMGLAIHWRWFPAALWESPLHAVLPTIALGLYFGGKVARLMREGVLATLDADFVTTARAKGLSENQVMIRHVLRIAILPVVSYLGPMLADLLTGSFVVENLFQIPGMGVFLVNSSLNRDYPMVVGVVMLYAVLLLWLNLIVDFAYGLLDRRIRYE